MGNKWPMLFFSLLLASRLAAQTEYTLDGTPSALEEEIRWLLNRGRYDSAAENAARGSAYTDVSASVGPLAPHTSAMLSARHHSEDMAVNNWMGNPHQTVTGSSYYDPVTQPEFWHRMLAEGYPASYKLLTENVGGGNVATIDEIYAGWWHSTVHRVNMFDENVSEFGAGHFYDATSLFWNYYTINMGGRWDVWLFTGTCFSDADDDNTYDQGEGVSGIEVKIVVNGTPTDWYDVSEGAGSFAIPIMDIPLNTPATVQLRNTTSGPVSLSIPLDYSNHITLTLAAGTTSDLGSFITPDAQTDVYSLGFRDLTPPRPTALISSVSPDFTLSWNSSAIAQYQVERGTNLVDWVPVTDTFSNGTGSTMSYTDLDAHARDSNCFYRIQTRWNP